MGMDKKVIFVNNTNIDLRDFEAEIQASLLATGKLPEELDDVLTVRVLPADQDGFTRFVLDVL